MLERIPNIMEFARVRHRSLLKLIVEQLLRKPEESA